MNNLDSKVVLLVEDNPLDARMTADALKACSRELSLQVVMNGQEALAFLRKKGKYAGARRPDLVLLDLHLPGLDGREVLAEIKSDADLKSIPVIVMSTSAASKDVLTAYALNVNCFICKPVELDQFIKTVQLVHQFWLATALLPKADCGPADVNGASNTWSS